MTPTQIRTNLQRLGLTQVRAADLLGISGRQMRRIVLGEISAPLWLGYALRGLEAELRRMGVKPPPVSPDVAPRTDKP